MPMKEMVKIVDNSKPLKSPEERQYLICIAAKDGGNDIWDIITGRTNAYEFIKDNIEFINLEESFILVESNTLSQRKSIYAFLKYVEKFYEDNFDVDDYIKGDWSEDDFRKYNDIDQGLSIDTNDRLDMSSIMNGDVETTSLE